MSNDLIKDEKILNTNPRYRNISNWNQDLAIKNKIAQGLAGGIIKSLK